MEFSQNHRYNGNILENSIFYHSIYNKPILLMLNNFFASTPRPQCWPHVSGLLAGRLRHLRELSRVDPRCTVDVEFQWVNSRNPRNDQWIN